MDLANQLAYRVARTCPPGVTVDELKAAGYFGLVRADKKYNPNKGATFRTYAGFRIMGEILDAVRSLDYFPRRGYEEYKMDRLENYEREGPTIDDAYEQYEIEEALRIAIDKLENVEWLIVFLYYQREMTMIRIGHVFDLTESRVSQKLAKVREKLRVSLHDNYGPNS